MRRYGPLVSLRVGRRVAFDHFAWSGEGHRRSDDLLLAELGRMLLRDAFGTALDAAGAATMVDVAATAADVDRTLVGQAHRVQVLAAADLLDVARLLVGLDVHRLAVVGQHGLRARLHFLGDDGLQPAGRFGQRFRGLGMCSRLQHRQRDEGTFHRYSPSVLEQR